MEAIISNKAHPDWGCATIPLPIPDEEYAHCMELLEQLEIGGVTASDCHIDRLDHYRRAGLPGPEYQPLLGRRAGQARGHGVQAGNQRHPGLYQPVFRV